MISKRNKIAYFGVCLVLWGANSASLKQTNNKAENYILCYLLGPLFVNRLTDPQSKDKNLVDHFVLCGVMFCYHVALHEQELAGSLCAEQTHLEFGPWAFFSTFAALLLL